VYTHRLSNRVDALYRPIKMLNLVDVQKKPAEFPKKAGFPRPTPPETVELILKLHAKHYTLQGIADYLRSNKIPAAQSGRPDSWTATTVRRIILRFKPDVCSECGRLR